MYISVYIHIWYMRLYALIVIYFNFYFITRLLKLPRFARFRVICKYFAPIWTLLLFNVFFDSFTITAMQITAFTNISVTVDEAVEYKKLSILSCI